MYECRYCKNDGYYFVWHKEHKIKRYGMYCDKCNRMIKWIPDSEAEMICQDDVREYVEEKVWLGGIE